MATSVKLNLGQFFITNEQMIGLRGGRSGTYYFGVEWQGARPSQGQIWLEYKEFGQDVWTAAGDPVDVSDDFSVEVHGAVTWVRLREQNLSNDGGPALLWYSEIGPRGFPDGAFDGLRALTVQGYVEANSKRGLQYEFSSQVTNLAAGASVDAIFRTGSNPVLIKKREVGFNVNRLTATVYRTPTYTGGVSQQIYNLSDINPVIGEASVLLGATVTDPGTQFGAPTYMLGSDGQGVNRVATVFEAGAERVLAPNTTYMLRLKNDSAQAAIVSSYLTWYEGPIDFP